jgi:hypothetical protein
VPLRFDELFEKSQAESLRAATSRHSSVAAGFYPAGFYRGATLIVEKAKNVSLVQIPFASHNN